MNIENIHENTDPSGFPVQVGVHRSFYANDSTICSRHNTVLVTRHTPCWVAEKLRTKKSHHDQEIKKGMGQQIGYGG